jgi:hypothetical protein
MQQMAGAPKSKTVLKRMNPVTAAHVHLLLGHVPVVALLFGAIWLALGVWRGSQEVQQAALGMFTLAAALTVPLYLTGQPATGLIKGLPGSSDRILEQHEAAAGVALAACLGLGLVAVGGLIHCRGRRVAKWLVFALLVGSLATGGLMMWTANLGGQIRHSEIRRAASDH